MLVLAPVGKDAALVEAMLRKDAVRCLACADFDHLSRELERGAAAILLAEEALPRDGRLVDLVQRQPPWSDLPVLVLTRPGADSAAAARAIRTLGNVTLLERPVRVTTLASAVHSALRARDRQYQTRAYLREREEADQRKDEFLATLAHELRNPLAPIRNGLQIARLSSRNDETLQRVVAMMDRQLTHLVRLVDDLLDVARIGAGKIVLERRAVDVADVLARSIESARALLDERGHTLDVAVPAGSVMVDADPERLAQVFTNLLSNAAKYTERGGRVSVRVEVSGDETVVRVADTGIGIAPEDLLHVFDLFSQARVPEGHTDGGLGIGLALVRKLVEIHGGTVTAHSDGWGRGCTMTVRLPLLRVQPVPDALTHASTPSPATQGRTVVVADDNVDAAESLGMLLRFQGHDVTIVHDGAAAVAAVQARPPDVVVLDLGMPGLDGLEAAKRIRAMPGGREVRLIALTGWGQDSDRARTREAGFDHHLVKPADPAEVAALLRKRGAGEAGRPLSN